MLYDMWRFYVTNSTGPWIDRGSFDPRNCAKGVYRKRTGISFNIYDIDNTGSFTDLLWIESSVTGTNGEPKIDTDYDGKTFHIVYSDIPQKKSDLI